MINALETLSQTARIIQQNARVSGHWSIPHNNIVWKVDVFLLHIDCIMQSALIRQFNLRVFVFDHVALDGGLVSVTWLIPYLLKNLRVLTEDPADEELFP